MLLLRLSVLAILFSICLAPQPLVPKIFTPTEHAAYAHTLLLEVMRQYQQDGHRRIIDRNDKRFMYEDTYQYEEGYLIQEIIERYRKIAAYVVRSKEFVEDGVMLVLRRVEHSQKLYFEVYHLVRMLHEIPRKYGENFNIYTTPRRKKHRKGGKDWKDQKDQKQREKGENSSSSSSSSSSATTSEEDDDDDADDDDEASEVDEGGADPEKWKKYEIDGDKLVQDAEQRDKERAKQRKQRRKDNKKLRDLIIQGKEMQKYKPGTKKDPYNKWWPIDYGWEIDWWW